MSEQVVALPHNPDYPVLTPTQAQAALAYLRDTILASRDSSRLTPTRIRSLLGEAHQHALNYFE